MSAQLASSTFNLDANLALLRLYQFHPSLIKVPVIVKVLLKAITQLPGAEYKACIHLVHERLQVRGRACLWAFVFCFQCILAIYKSIFSQECNCKPNINGMCSDDATWLKHISLVRADSREIGN